MNIYIAFPFKRQTKIAIVVLLVCCVLLTPARQAQKRQPAAKKPAINIDDKALRQADARAGDWITHGRTYSETRYSPLKQIDSGNVKKLGLAWSFDTQTNRGLEATPLVVDGVMYTTGSWSVVYALDAKTGEQLWKYDPEVSRSYGARACCDVVNRGVAVYKGKVYVGALDGRLIALDASDGKVVWEITTVDQNQPYTITGAPRVVKGKVIIGNGGGEYGVRGYVSAYDAETGKQIWRFYTVPGDPSLPFESPALEKAAKTWTGEWWKMGGGGTVWDSLAYDPELDLLYVGAGNGSPWNQQIRSPQGGDNLYLSCILALRPDTGELIWHYQITPGDTWDYTATQHMIMADLNIGGRERKVLMQAPKNGFFYVLDRATGELISAEPYVEVTWAKGVDKKTGRPIENPAARYKNGFSLQKPGPLGGHNWMPMSFNPQTGLVYIPAQDIPGLYTPDTKFKYRPGAWNTGVDFSPMKDAPPSLPPGHLLAWDPVAQKERWRAPYKMMWNGGTLTTAGNLVFQGTSDGRFIAYSADKGENLWESPVGIGVIGSPMTYEVDGVQYVSVMAGWGGAFALVGGYALTDANTRNVGRLLTFALDAKASLAVLPKRTLGQAPPVESNATPEMINKGGVIFTQWCAVCHGVGAVGGGGVITALPMSKPEVFKMYKEIVLDGDYSSRGMPAFGKWLSADDVESIRAYIIKRRTDLTEGK
ncbi:MAG TPA: PQQ-dependent dehydrogenase, methanol/ethanol family [Blastocatellia bacterium]|jgi:PQQ-dependent dehydrogenase (methanol/ethanol family)|nr:PQQ-dependent dehydrogenase, methanol/ethanol family [Blastocatellia bacterium]